MTMSGTADAANEMHVTMLIQSCARASSSVSGLISSRLPTIPITNSTHHSQTMPVVLRGPLSPEGCWFGCPPPGVAHHERGDHEVCERDEPACDRPTGCPRTRRGVPQLGVLGCAVEVDDEHDEDRERDHAENGRHRAHQIVGISQIAEPGESRRCRRRSPSRGDFRRRPRAPGRSRSMLRAARSARLRARRSTGTA